MVFSITNLKYVDMELNANNQTFVTNTYCFWLIQPNTFWLFLIMDFHMFNMMFWLQLKDCTYLIWCSTLTQKQHAKILALFQV